MTQAISRRSTLLLPLAFEGSWMARLTPKAT